MTRKTALAITTAMMAFTAAPALAQNADVTADLNMRAGPGTGYPVITTIPDGRGVDVHGCVSSRNWCDVSWRGNRGWVYSDYLEYRYHNRRRPIPEWGTELDLPVLTFSFGNYAERHYRNQPWYGDRDRWERHNRDHDRRGDRHDNDRHGRWNDRDGRHHDDRNARHDDSRRNDREDWRNDPRWNDRHDDRQGRGDHRWDGRNGDRRADRGDDRRDRRGDDHDRTRNDPGRRDQRREDRRDGRNDRDGSCRPLYENCTIVAPWDNGSTNF